MSTVWAVMRKRGPDEKSTGAWIKGSWDYLIDEFRSLGDLVGQLKRLGVSQIDKLGIVAHGDADGVVQLEQDLTAESAMSFFKSDLSALSQLMTKYGRLIFFSCIAGANKPGTKLLNTLTANFFHDRYVIGFEKFAVIGPDNSTNTAGVLQIGLHASKQIDYIPGDQTGDQHLTEHSWYSKWSFNGTIIRIPKLEEEAPTRTATTTYGPKAVAEAIRRNNHEIEYVAIDKARAHSAALREVVDALLRWVPGSRDNISRYPKDGKLRYTTSLELNHLAGTRQHGGAVVKWIRVIKQYRCANPACPGHSEPWHFCIDYLKRFTNGPLQWP